MTPELTNLISDIKAELDEDLNNRYDGDYEAWVEVVYDCPSDSLEKLLSQIPEDMISIVYEDHIEPFISSLYVDNGY
jgi:ABC-type cobalt transport system substrate-binding protein